MEISFKLLFRLNLNAKFVDDSIIDVLEYAVTAKPLLVKEV